MIKYDILILGNGGAAISAVKTIRKVDKEITIGILAKEKEIFYSPVLLPYYVQGTIERDDLFVLGYKFYQKNSISLQLESNIRKLNAKDKQVTLGDGSRIIYDKLVIATGASPSMPDFKGIDNQGVFSLRTVEDSDNLLKHMRRKVVVIGAGAVAIGIAIALRKKGLDVHVLYRKTASHIIGGKLDMQFSKEIVSILERNGISFLFQQDPSGLEISGNPVKSVRGSGIDLACDTVVVATGVKPNTYFIDQEEISLGKKEGILVDDTMRTSAADVFAAGDCVETVNFVTGNFENNPIWPNAIEQGKIAGFSLLGIECHYKGFIKRNVINLFDQCLFMAGEAEGEVRCTESENSSCRFFLRDNVVVGCQSLGYPDKYGVYLRMIKRKSKAVDEFCLREASRPVRV